MQTSGMFPQLSDGTRKTVTGSAPPKPAKPEPPPKANSHRRGGQAAKGSR